MKDVMKISFLQAGIILMLSNGLASHVIIQPIILGVSGRDAWLVPLITFAVLIPWCWALVSLMRRSGYVKLNSWLTARIGKAWTLLLLLPLYLQLYLSGAGTTLQTSSWAVVNYLPTAPRTLIVALLLTISIYSALHGIRAFAIGSGILLPVVIVLGYFVATTNLQHKDYRLLQPVLEDGWAPVLKGTIYSCACFMELAYLLPLQHYLKRKVKLWQLLVLLLIFIHIMVGPLIGAITEFGPYEAAKQMLPPYEQWRLVHIGSYLEHVDFLALYQWMSGATVRVGLSLLLLADLIPARRLTLRRWTILGIAMSYFLIAFLPISRSLLYEWQKMIFFATLPLIAGIVIVCVSISLFSNSKKEQPA